MVNRHPVEWSMNYGLSTMDQTIRVIRACNSCYKISKPV